MEVFFEFISRRPSFTKARPIPKYEFDYLSIKRARHEPRDVPLAIIDIHRPKLFDQLAQFRIELRDMETAADDLAVWANQNHGRQGKDTHLDCIAAIETTIFI